MEGGELTRQLDEQGYEPFEPGGWVEPPTYPETLANLEFPPRPSYDTMPGPPGFDGPWPPTFDGSEGNGVRVGRGFVPLVGPELPRDASLESLDPLRRGSGSVDDARAALRRSLGIHDDGEA